MRKRVIDVLVEQGLALRMHVARSLVARGQVTVDGRVVDRPAHVLAPGRHMIDVEKRGSVSIIVEGEGGPP